MTSLMVLALGIEGIYGRVLAYTEDGSATDESYELS